MNLFSVGGTEQANQDSFARANPLKADDLKAGFFEGIPQAAALGAGAAVNNYARPMADAAKGIDGMFKTDMSGWLAKEQEKTQQASRDLTPNPATVGWLGQQVYGATNMIGSVAIGTIATGNPITGAAVGAAAMGNSAFNQAREDGLDFNTSVGMGGITAGSTFIGAFLPVTATTSMATGLLGKAMGAEVAGNAATAAALYTAAGATATIATNLPAKIAAAGAINTATGIPTRGATSALLEANGYADMAKQYEAFSMSEMISDFAVGSIFGLGIHGYQKWEQANQNKIPAAQMSDLDAVLALTNAAHIEIKTSPGIPTDPATREAHVEAINKALADLAEGRPVDVGQAVTEGNFIEDPVAVQTRTEIVRVVEDHMGPEWEGLQADLAARGMPTDTNLYQVTRTPADQMSQVRPTMEVNRIIERGKAEGWDTERMITELETLKGKLEQRNEAQLEARTGDRVRGELWVRERLLRAERNGELPPEAVRLANWLIDQNPNLVADIGLSFKKSGDVQGEAGGYNPLARIVTLIKGRANDETVIHEILHHAERMMPEGVQKAIQAEWFKELRAVTQMATRTQNATLMKATDDALRAANGDERAFRNLAEAIANGEVDERFYALANPSEFWAVNGSRILRERASEGWVQQAKQWLAEFIEKVKATFGLRSDAAVIRGLNDVLKSDGAFLNDNLLADAAVPRMRQVIQDNAKRAIENEGGNDVKVGTINELVASDKIRMLEPSDLLGMNIITTIADRTRAGATFTGIDGSKLQAAVDLLGGPLFPLRTDNMATGVGWANRGGSVLTKLKNKIEAGADHIMVVLGSPEMHQSNTTVTMSMIGQLEAYIRDGHIPKKNTAALTEMIRTAKEADPAIAKALQGMPDLGDAKASIAYLDSISFEARKRVATIMSSVKASDLGAPNFEKILRATAEPEMAGGNWGDGVLVIKINKENPVVVLGENGTTPHPDFPLGVQGEVVGKMRVPLSWKLLYQDFISESLARTEARGKKGDIDTARYDFQQSQPMLTVTPDLIERIGKIERGNIESARQAKLAVALANDTWVSSETFGKGGERSASPTEFFHQMKASDASPILPTLDPAEITAQVRAKTRTIYQLDDGMGDKPTAGVYFSLNRVGDRVVLDAWLNNEQGARGLGGAIIAKSIEKGATHAEVISIPTASHPMGKTIEALEAMGFEVIGSKKAQLGGKRSRADAIDLFARNGWKEGDPEPKLVTLKWSGNEEQRAGFAGRYLAGDTASLHSAGAGGHVARAREAAGQSGRSPDQQGRAGEPDARANGRDQGDAGGTGEPDIRAAIESLGILSDNSLANLGLKREDLGVIAATVESASKTANSDTTSQILVDNPFVKVADEAGAEAPAAVLLANADAEIATAKQDSQGYDAAVACALRG